MNTPKKKPSLLLALIAPSLLLTGCAATSSDSMPVQCPQIPPPLPSFSKPVPQESFLERAQRNIEAWQRELNSSASN